MKNALMILLLLAAMSGQALAGSAYDSCIKEEKALKARETEECHGLRYLLNPSACFATQKTLKEYKSGKCRNIGTAEGVDFNARPVIPEKKSSIVDTTSDAGKRAGTVKAVAAPPAIMNTAVPTAEIKAVPETVRQEAPIDQLREENIRLKAENSRLKTENEQLRKTVR